MQPYDGGREPAVREPAQPVVLAHRRPSGRFLAAEVADDVLARVLRGALGDAGHRPVQPWEVLLLRSPETRRRVQSLAQRQQAEYAPRLEPGGAGSAVSGSELDTVVDAPVNLAVLLDRGQASGPAIAVGSLDSCLAVERLWRAAAAEGLTLSPVWFPDPRGLADLLGLPAHIDVVAYACVGHRDAGPDDRASAAPDRPLSWAVHQETYGRRGLPGEEPMNLLVEALDVIRPLDEGAMAAARARQEILTGDIKALGVLGAVGVQLSGLAGSYPPPVPEPAVVVVFAADHGIHRRHGLSSSSASASRLRDVLEGRGVVAAAARQVGADVRVFDVGLDGAQTALPGVVSRTVRSGTADFTEGPAMSRAEAREAVEVGIEVARELVLQGYRCLVTADPGIAGTAASAALVAAFTGADPLEVTSRGVTPDHGSWARTVEVVRSALALHSPQRNDPMGVLSRVGGLEHAALVGLLLGAAAVRVPVVLDGVAAAAAALAAAAGAPEAAGAWIAGHLSAERGHAHALRHLELRPLVDLELRAGVGAGALLAVPLVQSAARALQEDVMGGGALDRLPPTTSRF